MKESPYFVGGVFSSYVPTLLILGSIGLGSRDNDVCNISSNSNSNSSSNAEVAMPSLQMAIIDSADVMKHHFSTQSF